MKDLQLIIVKKKLRTQLLMLQQKLRKVNKNELAAEKKERENSEDTLLVMLENTCNKIQKLNQ